MSKPAQQNAPGLAEKVRDILSTAGYRFFEPPILQDADLFLDLAGEDLRRRLFLTPSADDVELCLRPDYTIPVCLHHVSIGAAGRRGDYAYLGPVFRQRTGETGEFRQAGVESIGRKDIAVADADVMALALSGIAAGGVKRPNIRIGDSGLFAALLDALGLPTTWKRRLARSFGDRPRMEALIARIGGESEGPRPAYAGFLATLDGNDHTAARRVVDDLLAIAGVTAVGGRTAAEIAERFLEQAALEAAPGKRPAEILRKFLAIEGSPADAAVALAALATKERLNLAEAIERFERRSETLAAHGIALDRIAFSAGFGRRLDYYTGFVFEAHHPTQPELGPLAGGGRYDRLLSLIVTRDGSGPDIPAVGFALWLDRLEARK
jgi:ATP phosphoribosyltransferase regulatory subunit